MGLPVTAAREKTFPGAGEKSPPRGASPAAEEDHSHLFTFSLPDGRGTFCAALSLILCKQL